MSAQSQVYDTILRQTATQLGATGDGLSALYAIKTTPGTWDYVDFGISVAKYVFAGLAETCRVAERIVPALSFASLLRAIDRANESWDNRQELTPDVLMGLAENLAGAAIAVAPMVPLLGPVAAPLELALVSGSVALAVMGGHYGDQLKIAENRLFENLGAMTGGDLGNLRWVSSADKDNFQALVENKNHLVPAIMLMHALDPNAGLSDLRLVVERSSPGSYLDNSGTLIQAMQKLLTGALIGKASDVYSLSAQTKAAYDAFSGYFGRARVIPLATMSAAEVAGIAANPDAYATRYALRELNPFAVVGVDYSIHNGGGRLELQDLEAGTGELSNEWLVDRAAMLSWKLQLNGEDYPSSLANPYHAGPDVYFMDYGSGERIVLGYPPMGQMDRRFILFGSDAGETLYGTSQQDRLYGMGGDDTLSGGNNSDYLEGGAGADRLDGGSGADELRGGAGADTLIGGTGDDSLKGGAEADTLYGDAELENDTASGGEDTLEGGEGSDKLYGGAGTDALMGDEGADTLRGGAGAADYLVGGEGNDTYVYGNRDQADLLWDEDGQGRIEYDRIALEGGTRPQGSTRNLWRSADGRHTFETDGDPERGPVTLTVRSAAGGRLSVLDYDNGELGIRLSEAPNTPGTARNGAPPPAPPMNPGSAARLDPLVVDLAGAGIATVGLGAGLHFDQDGDGFAEASGWAAEGAGLLMRDANGNGRLDDGTELFGDATVLPGGQHAANGFAALSQYDRNRDGRIDAGDAIWQELRVAVREADPRGGLLAGDPQETVTLKTLDELGIESISLDSAIATATDANGNTRTRSGTITLADGTTREIAEYRFARDNSETKFLDWRDLPEQIAVLPELTLGGVQMELSQALVRDAEEGYLGNPPGSLRAKLDAFMNEADPAQYHARFEELLYAWTGAEAIAAGSMTNGLDARHARVLEQAYGRSFQNPDAEQAAAWRTAYERLAEWACGQLLAQTHLAPLYEAIDWQASEVTGAPFGDLAGAQALLEAELLADAQRGRALINEFGRSLRALGLARARNGSKSQSVQYGEARRLRPCGSNSDGGLTRRVA